MMKVIFDCERMKYTNTGLFSYCLQLGIHLREQFNTSSEELSYFIPPQVKGIFGDENECILQHSAQKFFMPSLRNYDVWHSTFQNSHYLPFLNKKIKVVLTIHDLNFIYDSKKSEGKKKKYLDFLQKNINRSDAIVCISEFSKNDVLRYCQVGNRPILVIHNGTNNLQPPVLFGNSYRPRTKFLFSIGVVSRKKNFHVLLPLLQHNVDMELLIAGRPDDPDYVHYIKDTAKNLGVEEKVRVLGPITEPEKSWYFQNCYAFTFPSLSEGFGLPVTEAMSVGKPLFLSNRTALPEIGQDVAFYFPDFNEHHMQKVFIKGMKQYQTQGMEELIKKRSTDFCWQKSAAQYINLYRSLY